MTCLAAGAYILGAPGTPGHCRQPRSSLRNQPRSRMLCRSGRCLLVMVEEHKIECASCESVLAGRVQGAPIARRWCRPRTPPCHRRRHAPIGSPGVSWRWLWRRSTPWFSGVMTREVGAQLQLMPVGAPNRRVEAASVTDVDEHRLQANLK